MIRVIVSYPNDPTKKFDLDYYMAKHMPMVAAKLGPHGMKTWTVTKGLAGMAPGSPAAFMIQASLDFATMEGVQAGMALEAPGIMADIPNYTDIAPQIQIDEVLGS